MKKIIAILLFSCVAVYAFSQGIKVQGTVTDITNNEPLPGVNVVIDSSTRGVITDMNGNFAITVDNEKTVLQFSYIGYLVEIVEVGTKTNLQVTMVPDIKQLEEVVVIGYGTVKKADATGAVAVVGSDDFNKGTTNSVQELIVGKSAGVVISTNSGAPGNSSTIRIRGGSSLYASNDPLIVIDGVPLDNNSIGGSPNLLATLNPNDIESFTILKDASATAIYGARASNGVIIITTKRGTKEFKVNYNASLSLSTIPKTIDVYTGDEFRSLINTQFAGNENAINLLGDANTDWQNEIYQNAFAQDHNLNVSGMVLKTPYRVSLGYNNSDGILKTYNFERTTLSLGVDPSLFKDHLKVKVNLKGMANNNNFAEQGAIGSAVNYDPTKPVHNENTRWRGYTVWTDPLTNINGSSLAFSTSNPVAQLDLTDNTSQALSSIGNVQLDYSFHFLPDLHANLNLGYDYAETKGHNNAPDSTSWTNSPTVAGGRINPFNNIRKNKLLDFYLNYSKELTSLQSRIEVMGGYSWSHFYRERNDSTMNVAMTDTINQHYFRSEYYLLSYFGRFNYTFKERYILTFTLRDDATSRFAPENRWGLFPSVAFAWRISEEAFLKNNKVLSDLKLRLGWGITGQQDIISDDDYPYLATYTLGNPQARYQFGNNFITTLRPDGYDANIKWEEGTNRNIGLDFGFLKNRITGTIDVYKKTTTDLINTVQVPAGTNTVENITTNVGSMENNGVELSLNANIISKKDFGWNLGYNISYNENKITKLNLNDDPNYIQAAGSLGGLSVTSIQANRINYPINSFYVYQQIYDTDGTPLEGVYVDQDTNGIINSNDLISFKSPAPVVLMGISSSINYKNWDFSFSGRVSLGNYLYNEVNTAATYNNVYRAAYKFLQNETKNLDETQFDQGLNTNLSNYYIENASFFRMDNMSLGYRFTKIANGKLNLHLSATVQNAFVITKYSGLDPEINGGIDNNVFPRPRIFMFGINCEF